MNSAITETSSLGDDSMWKSLVDVASAEYIKETALTGNDKRIQSCKNVGGEEKTGWTQERKMTSKSSTTQIL